MHLSGLSAQLDFVVVAVVVVAAAAVVAVAAAVVPVVAAAGVTQFEFVVWLKSRSYFDLQPWELMEYTVVCWVEWEGLSGEGGK